MKTPLNVCWHYHFYGMSAYRDHTNSTVILSPSYGYQLKNGEDNLNLDYRAIKISTFEQFIKGFNLASNFKTPTSEENDMNSIRNIVVIPGVQFFISLIYSTRNLENHLTFNIIKKDENVFEYKIIRNSTNKHSQLQTERNVTQLISKAEVRTMFCKLPETVDLGIFKLPFGNWFECESVEH